MECKIPLLLSKGSLVKAGAVIDIGKDHVMMFDQKVNFQTTSTGHYYVNIKRNNKESTYDKNIILVVDSNMKRSDKRNALLKLHKQFGHALQEKLLNLLMTAGIVDQETKYLLKFSYKKCAICHKYTHPKMKPIVGLNPANDFNQVIALDLHEFGPGLWDLHMIDLFSRLSMAVVIHCKETGVIVDENIQNWVAIYGALEIGLLNLTTRLFMKWRKS